MGTGPTASSDDCAGRARAVQDARWFEHNSARRARLVEAAVALLDEKPIGRDVSVEEIGNRAGLARSVFYRQFDSREAFDCRVRTVILDQCFEMYAMNLDFSTGSIDDIVTRTAGALLDWRINHPAWYAFLGSGPTDYDSPDLDAVQTLSRRFETLIDVSLSEIAQLVGVDYEPLRTLPFAVVAMVDGTFTRWLSDPSPVRSRAQLVRDVADYAWYMLDGAARRSGLCVDRDQTVDEVIAGVSAPEPPR
ncbi:TetR/AcrR family transcriptional regulator [Mycolicibacterium septicum]|uniref:TetR/AcrR family transcriptional regulator n=1 Tax=Mycolicibacterium septicum TaxID=98668 RepID=UPI0023E0C096|nr:TetR/AcrR family transcriptional regulator [Mycolicibacterium septicum]MDF3335930.1 TetR/AcrR family transcriptional regulator [Mycolicibacterium septicum]